MAIGPKVVPEFLNHDPVSRNWPRLAEDFPAFQVVLVGEDDRVAAAGFSVPLWWDGTTEGLPEGWDAAFEAALADHSAGRTPNATSALMAAVDPAYGGRGLGGLVLEAMKEAAQSAGLGVLIAPVRPTMKHLYPLTPIEDYVGWKTTRGEAFDPWLRAHERLGARRLKDAPRSMVITGCVAE